VSKLRQTDLEQPVVQLSFHEEVLYPLRKAGFRIGETPISSRIDRPALQGGPPPEASGPLGSFGPCLGAMFGFARVHRAGEPEPSG